MGKIVELVGIQESRQIRDRIQELWEISSSRQDLMVGPFGPRPDYLELKAQRDAADKERLQLVQKLRELTSSF